MGRAGGHGSTTEETAPCPDGGTSTGVTGGSANHRTHASPYQGPNRRSAGEALINGLTRCHPSLL